MRNRWNNYKAKCCAGDIVILAVISFLIIIVIYTLAAYMTGAFAFAFAAESDKDKICDTAKGWEENYDYCDKQYDKLVEKDEQIHKEWAKENEDSDIYQPVKCMNDDNIYPEGTKCDGKPNIDEDEIKDNSEVNRQEEKAMREADD